VVWNGVVWPGVMKCCVATRGVMRPNVGQFEWCGASTLG